MSGRASQWRTPGDGDAPAFAKRISVEQVEEGTELAPRFDADGLIPVVTTDAETGELLMHGYMNREALARTLQLGEAVYWSRSRKALWHKGATSGFTQRVVELRVDDDQDALWLRVAVQGGASCHVGYRSCFYRRVRMRGEAGQPGAPRESSPAPVLEFTETTKVFDPEAVYGDAPNPTVL